MPRASHLRWLSPLLAVLVTAGALHASAAQGRTLALVVAAVEATEAPAGTARDTVPGLHPWAAVLGSTSDDAASTAPAASGGVARLAAGAAGMSVSAPAERRANPVPLRHLCCVYRL